MEEDDSQSVATSKTAVSAPTAQNKAKSKAKNAKGKAGKSVRSKDEAEATVLAYLTAQCRPYNSTKVFENLLKTISHPVVKTVLAALVAQGALQEKVEGRAALYWVTQNDQDESPEAREAVCKGLLAEIAQVDAQLHEARAALALEEAARAQLEQEPADDDLDTELEAARAGALEGSAEVAKLRAACVAAGGQVGGDDDRSLQDLRAERKFWDVCARDLKRNVMGFVYKMADGTGEPPQQILEEVGLVTDEMAAAMVPKSAAPC